MRWIEKEPKERPKIGSKRINKGFLLFSLKIGKETRWLENARWMEEYRHIVYNGEDFWLWHPIYWDPKNISELYGEWGSSHPCSEEIKPKE